MEKISRLMSVDNLCAAETRSPCFATELAEAFEAQSGDGKQRKHGTAKMNSF